MVALVVKQFSALRNKKGKNHVIYYNKKSIRHLAMDEWFGKGLTKRQQGLPGLAYYLIEITSKEQLLIIDQHTREVEAPITWLNSRGLESSDPDSILIRVRISNQ